MDRFELGRYRNWKVWPNADNEPFVSRTRATLRKAELGFLGVVV